MARIRSVKPAMRTSAVVASWPREIRYAFVLLWGYLDDSGRGLDVPKGIAGDCFPHDDDVTPKKMDTWLTRMTKGIGGKAGPLCRYEVDGIRYLHCVNWPEHQRVNRPTPSMHPPCPLHDGLTESLTESVSESPPKDSVPDATRVGDGDGDGDGDGVPPTAGAPPRSPDPEATGHTPNAQTLIGEWIDHCVHRPPKQVIGQASKQVKDLLDEGIHYDAVRAGLAQWHAKGLHPSALPSVVNEVLNARPRASPGDNGHQLSTTERKVAAALEAGARVQALFDQQQRLEIAS